MANSKIILLLSLITISIAQLAFPLSGAAPYSISPTIILYEGKNQSGKSFGRTAAYVPDLSVQDFDNQAQSACVNGTWLLYNQPNYNPPEVPGAMEYVSGHSYCTNLFTIGQQVSSLRFVGSALDTESDSITFYSETYFQGLEEYFTESAPYFDTLKNGSKSVIVTGTLGWRLFERSHFQGESVCISEKGISGISTQPSVLLVPNIAEQYNHFLVGTVLSARPEGCF